MALGGCKVLRSDKPETLHEVDMEQDTRYCRLLDSHSMDHHMVLDALHVEAPFFLGQLRSEMALGDDAASMELLVMEVPFSVMVKVDFFLAVEHNGLLHTMPVVEIF